MNHVFSSAAAAAVLSLALVPTYAIAGHAGHDYNGARCMKAGSSGTEVRWVQGMVGNGSSAESEDMEVTCPIEGTGHDELTVGVDVSDNSSDENVSCRAHACTAAFASCIATSYSSTSGTGVDTLALATNWSIGLSRLLMAVQCSLPDNDGTASKVIAYYGYHK